MNFLSVLYAKAGITVDGVTTLNNTATGLTPATNDNSTKLATTGYVKNQNYYPYPTGTTAQYVRGDGSLATFTQTGGGGSSVSYYLNGSVSQGTIGGNTYYEMSKTAIIGTNADFTINANGYIAQFVTDAGDPALLNIPGGNWNFEMFFSASSGGGSPSFYVQLYKYDGTTLTLIASGSAVPESITGGTSIDLYVTALAVPTTTLTLTDRLAIRVYVTHSGRTITLHTQDSHLCQVITTFTTGLTALNGLTAQVQNFAVGAGGSDFNISSVTDTHTFNLPTASATKRGALSSIDWSAFDAKVDFGDLSATSPLSYNGSGVFTIAQSSTSTNGYLSSTDWNTFNNKIGGSGTANYIAKFTSGSVVGNSIIYDNGTNVGIGTVNPNSNGGASATVVHIHGVNSGDWAVTHYTNNNTGAAADDGTVVGVIGSGGDMYIFNYENSSIILGTNSNERMRIAPSGNVLIGTTSGSFPLTVVGKIGANIFGDSYLEFLSNGHAILKANNDVFIGYSQNFVVTQGGNVGIGTTSPSSKLQISTTASNPFRMVRTGGSATDFGFEIGSGDVGFYNYSSSTYGWYLTSANRFGLGTTNPFTKLEVYGGHNDTTARLYSTGNDSTLNASLDMWASEPGISYDGSGIGNNVNVHPFYGRRNTSIGQSYIRFISGQIIFYTGSTTANEALNITASGAATFKNNIILNSAGSDRFTVTTDGVVNWNPSGIGGFLTWDTGKAIVGANNSYALSFYTGGSERLIISGTTGAATFSSNVDINGTTLSLGSFNIVDSYLGYSSSYRILVLSDQTANNNIGLNYNPITNAGGSFNGTGQIFIANNKGILAPNSAGDNYIGVLKPIGTGVYFGGSLTSGDLTGDGLFISTAGNVGVNTNTPASKLQVEGANYSFIAGSDAGNRRVLIGLDTVGEPSIQATLSNGTARQLSINPVGGNVLIGTTTDAGYKLDVQGNAGLITINTNGALLAGSQIISGTGSFAASSSATDVVFNAGGTRLMTLKAGGNVGIGTTTPYYKTTIYNSSTDTDVLCLANPQINGDSAPHFVGLTLQDNDMSGGGNASAIRSYSNLYAQWGSKLTFSTTGNTGVGIIERVRINEVGNVLIGTTTDAGYKLDVNGTARVSGVATFSGSISSNRAAQGNINGINYFTAGTANWYVGSSAIGSNTDMQFYNHSAGVVVFNIANTTGAATFSSSVTAATGLFSSTGVGVFNSQLTINNTTSASALITLQNTINGFSFGFSSTGTGGQRFSFFNGSPTEIAYISGTGAATFSSTVNATSFTANNRTILTSGGLYDNATNGNNIGFGFGAGVIISTNGDGTYSAQNLGNATYPWYSARFVDRVTSLAWTTTGRNYSNEWIEFPNYSGLYSPNNGAHFFPNGSSYGAWKIQGSRNGWNGLEFGELSNGNISLMIAGDSSLVGFHNNGSGIGWVFYWSAGELKLSKGTYGGGTLAIVLDSSNFGSYALPLTGGTLTGILTLQYDYPRINLYDTNHDSDYSIINADGNFTIYDVTNNSNRLSIASNGAVTFASSVTATNFIVPGGTSAQFLKADGSLDSSVYLTATSSTFSYTASVTLSPTWQNTGVSSVNLGTGAYLVTCNANDFGVGGLQYNCTYTGIMYFFAGGTNGSDANEIVLHHTGHADNGRYIYLRTLSTVSADGKTYLQISGNGTNSAASNYQLTFKKLL